ncbi:MAG: bifunctional (p)ppGpp synthetase/guanosine-3',5'-bis(diphosphate) 3'-pyrophosphohydrolase [Bacteroidales bacterium]|nr:bifunctional (p)ppGpp synthetase/guanosine-3',5'-bis(diphosphate) 3'-pyrophosphohydrolase [Bacteroidales bacterium]
MHEIDEEREIQDIESKYQELLVECEKIKPLTAEERDTILRAYTMARKAHEGTRRKSGEAYIYHPLAVANIAVTEVGLGPIAVVCALLHDVVEDTEITLDDIRSVFGDRVARIVDGVTKIEDVIKLQSESKQAENFRKILLAMCDDAYVIFLKLCDRLHNMRTLGSMSDTKKLTISSETQYLYIPLAHRLGLYNIKTELEELVMKYTNPGPYAEISQKINKALRVESQLKKCFTDPICKMLDEHGYKYKVKTRVKSVYSCWRKMENKHVAFDEIYDLFAMRVILDVPIEKEKEACFAVYAMISSSFPPNPMRFRDWITTPKKNGYESLQTTVMSPIGRWVEVQIRTERMDEIAEKGMAAHFLYKEAHPEEKSDNNGVEEWLKQIRVTLENTEKSALDLVEEFKESLYTREIYVFTPKGETVKLPSGSTVLDFAFHIHSELGLHCIGAKVNSRVVPPNNKLRIGDQVQVLSSKKTWPQEDWLDIVTTPRTKEHIKDYLREQHRKYQTKGEQRLEQILKELGVKATATNLQKIKRHFNLPDVELYYQVAVERIGVDEIGACFGKAKKLPPLTLLSKYQNLLDSSSPNHEFLFDKAHESLDSQLAPCCKPIQGDDVIGIIQDDKIVVHRTTCKMAATEMSLHENRVVRAQWRSGEKVSFLTGVSITAIDRKGVLQDLTRVISEEMDLYVRAISLEASEGVGRGIIMLYVHDLDNLNRLMKRIRSIEGVEDVFRI